MSKNAPQISVLTANRLDDGVVVFLDGSGEWIEGIVAATIARSPEETRALEAQGARDTARNLVVDAYLVEVRESASGLAPVRTRERVRVAGPSILADVPGYAPPPPSPRLRGQTLDPAFVAAPHPDPLLIVKNDAEREKRPEAA